MRRRLAAAIAGVAIAALLLYAVPRTVVVVGLVREQERSATDRTADLIAQALDRRVREDRPTDAGVFAGSLRTGERLVVERRGAVDTVGSTEGGPTYRAERTLDTGGTVTVELGDAVVDERVADALESIVLAATGVLIFALLLASVLSRRLVRPFVALSAYADELRRELDGVDGTPAPMPRPAGIPEADDLAAALARTGDQVRQLVAREREFSANASHQLRTPLSALRLRIEDVSLWPEVTDDVRAELRAALGEVDRLSATATDLLELARRGGIGSWAEVEVGSLVAEGVDRWRLAFDEADRQIELRTPQGPTAVATSERALLQVVDVLVENALAHGVGAVEVAVERELGHVSVRVTDEGRISAELARRAFDRAVRSPSSLGSGIGLSLAQTIAEAAGARLALVSRDPTTFEVRFPITPEGTSNARG